jgi:5-methylcytosine-specific restriction endonuclease McrA
MQAHRIVPWQDAICKLLDSHIEPLETTWDGEPFVATSPSVSFEIPSVARLTTKIPFNKKGVKFSRTNVLTRDNFTCQYCGKRAPRRELNYDHVNPRKLGGRTVWENIVTSCYSCNSRKAGRTPEQAKMKLLRRPYRPKELPLSVPAIPIAKAPAEWAFYLGGEDRLISIG